MRSGNPLRRGARIAITRNATAAATSNATTTIVIGELTMRSVSEGLYGWAVEDPAAAAPPARDAGGEKRAHQ